MMLKISSWTGVEVAEGGQEKALTVLLEVISDLEVFFKRFDGLTK